MPKRNLKSKQGLYEKAIFDRLKSNDPSIDWDKEVADARSVRRSASAYFDEILEWADANLSDANPENEDELTVQVCARLAKEHIKDAKEEIRSLEFSINSFDPEEDDNIYDLAGDVDGIAHSVIRGAEAYWLGKLIAVESFTSHGLNLSKAPKGRKPKYSKPQKQAWRKSAQRMWSGTPGLTLSYVAQEIEAIDMTAEASAIREEIRDLNPNRKTKRSKK